MGFPMIYPMGCHMGCPVACTMGCSMGYIWRRVSHGSIPIWETPLAFSWCVPWVIGAMYSRTPCLAGCRREHAADTTTVAAPCSAFICLAVRRYLVCDLGCIERRGMTIHVVYSSASFAVLRFGTIRHPTLNTRYHTVYAFCILYRTAYTTNISRWCRVYE